MKKICSLLLALCVVLSCMSVSAAEVPVKQRTGMKPAAEKPVEVFEYGPIIDETRYKVTLNVEGDGVYGSASISGYGDTGNVGDELQIYVHAYRGYIAEIEYSYDYKTQETQMYYMGNHVYGVLFGDGDITVNVRFVPAEGSAHDIITGVSGRGYIDVMEYAKPGELLIATIRAESESYEITGIYLGYEDGTPIDGVTFDYTWHNMKLEFIMPDDEVVIYAEFKYKTTKNIELSYDARSGSATLSATDVEPGEEFVVTAVPAEGYYFGSIEAGILGYVEGSREVKLTPCGPNQWKGVMPNENIYVQVSFYAFTYGISVEVEHGIGGRAWCYREEGCSGEIITFDCEPDEGYYLARIEADNTRIGSYYSAPYAFIMPNEDVEIRVLFLREGNSFVDVIEGNFYYDPVAWAVKENITTGTSATTFNPNGQCQRAQVVTFLWRSSGCPEPTSAENPFEDVTASDFYYDAVLWAVENGITAGIDATHFGPNLSCSRAQVVTFLHRTYVN